LIFFARSFSDPALEVAGSTLLKQENSAIRNHHQRSLDVFVKANLLTATGTLPFAVEAPPNPPKLSVGAGAVLLGAEEAAPLLRGESGEVM